MDKWIGKVAVVTGASAGIGASLTVALANSGMQVVGLARRENAVEVSLQCVCVCVDITWNIFVTTLSCLGPS